ncbi:MAG: hypothetical protein GEV07_17385 [Streptosporangiales bacterium]|nr:hypothetical protein [Streptosporangiales bacterium]
MSKRPGRHRAREFARSVDSTGTPSSSVSRLVSLANALRNVPLRPLDGPRGSLRKQLVDTAAAGVPREGRPSLLSFLREFRLPRGLASAAIMCTALITIVGLGLGTANSLPGDTLYGMKMRGETVQLALIGSDEDRGRKNLQFASSRLGEVDRLVTNREDWPALANTSPAGRSAKVARLINRTLSAMDDNTAIGAEAMRQAFDETGDTAPLAYLDQFTEKQQQTLRSLLPKLPQESRPSAEHSIAFVSDLGEEAKELLRAKCGTATSCDDGETTAATNSSTEPHDPTSSTASASDSDDPSTPGRTSEGSESSSQHSSSSEPTTGGGSLTGSDPSSGSSSSESGSSSTSENTPSETETPSDSGTSTEEDSSSPPEPTGVPSSPSDSSPRSAENEDGSTSSSSTDDASSAESSSAPAESTSE